MKGSELSYETTVPAGGLLFKLELTARKTGFKFDGFWAALANECYRLSPDVLNAPISGVNFGVSADETPTG